MTISKKLSLAATFIVATTPSIGFCYTASDLDKTVLIAGLTATGVGISGAAGAIVTAIGIDKVCTAKKIKAQVLHSQPLRKSGIKYIKVGTVMMLPLAAIIAANAYDYSQIPSELKQPKKELIEEPKDTPKDQAV